jgi:uncharacterized alpha-E superfamily protein
MEELAKKLEELWVLQRKLLLSLTACFESIVGELDKLSGSMRRIRGEAAEIANAHKEAEELSAQLKKGVEKGGPNWLDRRTRRFLRDLHDAYRKGWVNERLFNESIRRVAIRLVVARRWKR